MPQSGDRSAAQQDPVSSLLEGVSGLLDAGYDFAELTVGAVVQLSEADFERFVRLLRQRGIVIPVFNSFIPASLKLTGPEAAEPSAVRAYVELAMQRVRAAGGEVIVFGSGAARTVPAPYTTEQGMEQIRQFLVMCGELAETYGITIAIEPLNRSESNAINKVAEALELAETLRLPRIRVLADAYHMHLEEEGQDIIGAAVSKDMLAHVHYAEFDRSFPKGEAAGGVDIAALLGRLRDSGYDGRVSAECTSADLPADSAESLVHIKRLMNRIYESGEQ